MTHDPLDPQQTDAILFDLDGVLTETATVHFAAWKRMFDEFLQAETAEGGGAFREFTEDDYHRWVDGRPRFDGVRTFLEHRGIDVPEGTIEDAPSTRSVGGLGNRKDAIFNRLVDAGVAPFPGAVAFVERAIELGIRTAVVSSSANAARVLEAAGIASMFETRVDGVVARELELPGKPAPDTYLEAARRLEAPPERAVVVEDALSGVRAGRAGNFGLVIGVGPPQMAGALIENGADLVVEELGALLGD